MKFNRQVIKSRASAFLFSGAHPHLYLVVSFVVVCELVVHQMTKNIRQEIGIQKLNIRE